MGDRESSEKKVFIHGCGMICAYLDGYFLRGVLAEPSALGDLAIGSTALKLIELLEAFEEGEG